MTGLVGVGHALVFDASRASEQHPAKVYVARLAPGSRRTMRHALDTVAQMLTFGACDAETLDWSGLRYRHTAAARAALAERYSPATANRRLRRCGESCARHGGSAS